MEMAQTAGRSTAGQRYEIDYGAWIGSGLIAGLIAGISFAIFEMIVAAIITGNFFGPFRMLAGTVLGAQALTPDVSLWMAALVGGVVHLVYSVISGAIFAFVIAAVRVFHSSKGAVIVTASIFGFLMWIVNFYIIAPAFGWFWFPENANQFWQGFIAHTFFYGSVVGWYLAARRI